MMLHKLGSFFSGICGGETRPDADFTENPWSSTIKHDLFGVQLILHCATPGDLKEQEAKAVKNGWRVVDTCAFKPSAREAESSARM